MDSSFILTDSSKETEEEIEGDIEDIKESLKETEEALNELIDPSDQEKRNVESIKKDYSEYFEEGFSEEESINKVKDYLQKQLAECNSTLEKIKNKNMEDENKDEESSDEESSGSITPTEENSFPKLKRRRIGDSDFEFPRSSSSRDSGFSTYDSGEFLDVDSPTGYSYNIGF